MKITLLGDSIRMTYQPLVSEQLEDKAVVWGPEENCEDSRTYLKNMDRWIAAHPADIIHFNCGLHDVKIMAEIPIQVPPDEYVSNLKMIVGKLKVLQVKNSVKLIWATTTPVVDEWHHKTKGFIRRESDVEQYNAKALEIINPADILVNDLHSAIKINGITKCVSGDGVHMNEFGNKILADTVVSAINSCMEKL